MSLIEFQDYPSTETPLNAENLNHNFNELNKDNIYSTEETFTGKYWINGKKIYRKVITASTLGNNETISIKHGITNLEYMIKQDLAWYDTNDKKWLCNSRVDSSSISIRGAGSNIANTSIACLGIDWSSRTSNVTITLEYTKTTE